MLRATLIALTVVGVCSVPVHASGLKATQSVDVATVTLAADGTEMTTFAPATDVEPGEQVRYRLSYVNEGSETAERVSLVMPVPSEVVYIEGSISGTASLVSFSVDAGQTYTARETLLIGEGADARPALSSEITHIKWDLQDAIAPSETGQIGFEAVLK